MEIKIAQELLTRSQNFLATLNLENLQQEITDAETQTYTSDFWQQENAQEIMQALATRKNQLESYQKLAEIVNEFETAIFLWQTEADTDPTASEYQPRVEALVLPLEKLLSQLESQNYLSAPYDQCSALFSIHSGQGGTEAMDWASMLARMYTRYFERHQWSYQLISESRGEEAGIKAVTYEVKASFAYGYLKHEAGTHRLVRQSPFNADNLRQTSFALVEVLPIIPDDNTEIKISDSDLEWQYTRAGGPGGQNVNKVNSAVELYYRPLDLTIRCREERSQEQNKQRALQILRAKIALARETERSAELAAVKGEFKQASWGNQIRNYVLHPYHLVKDTRTEVETSQTEAVLDGNLDDFIEAEIRKL